MTAHLFTHLRAALDLLVLFAVLPVFLAVVAFISLAEENEETREQ